MGVHRQILTDPSWRVQQCHLDAIKVYGIMREENRAQHVARPLTSTAIHLCNDFKHN